MASVLPPRSRPADLRDQIEAWMDVPLLQLALDALGGFVLVLNPARQVLAVSPELCRHLDLPDDAAARGLRPGEVFGCQNALRGPDGCQTSPQCPSCGAFVAMQEALALGTSVSGECHLECRRQGRFALREFRIKVTPLDLDQQVFLVVVLYDISDQRRKTLLERAFLHDLGNTLQGLQGALVQEHRPLAAQRVLELTQRLGEELQNHRLVMEIEEGRMAPRRQAIRTQEVFQTLAGYFQGHPASRDRRLVLEDRAPGSLHTDPILLQRVLANMVLNAMEASPAGATVLAWSRREERTLTFLIHNDSIIPASVTPDLFHRAVTTKRGAGRGLGTYAMRLIGEELLGGRVGFHSEIHSGTTFYISLDIHPA